MTAKPKEVNLSYPIRLTPDQKKSIADAAEKTKLKFPDVMRKAIDFGLPIVVQKMSAGQE